MGLKVEMNLQGLDGVLETLQSLPPEIVSKRGGPVKAALRKGALVIQKAAIANLQAATSNATKSGVHESTGLLLKNVIVTRGKPPSDSKGERYLVRVKRKIYARTSKGTPVSTLATARYLEYGTVKQPAEPWIRPAFLSRAADAITTTETELLKAIDKVVQKLASQNKGK